MNISQIYKQFPTQENCIRYIEKNRWKDKISCPYCKSTKITSFKNSYRHHCNKCNTAFSATVGTIFHQTHVPLQKWFLAISFIMNAKKDISSRQLARDLDVNKNTAWRMHTQIKESKLENLLFISRRDV